MYERVIYMYMYMYVMETPVHNYQKTSDTEFAH